MFWEVVKYIVVECGLLNVCFGIIDIVFIVFFDEGDIIKDFFDFDDVYDKLIWLWKSCLGFVYV